VVIYVETNFLMAMATGREPAMDDLLGRVVPPIVLAIPAVCYMEAFSALENDRLHRNRFKDQIEQQISQLKRDTTSAHARSLLAHLEQSRIETDLLLNDIHRRLFEVTDQLRVRVEMIGLTPELLRESLTTTLLREPTDQLILTCILGHARQHPDPDKTFFSGNFKDFDSPEARAALTQAGITRYFRSAATLLEWLMTRSEE